MIIKNLNLIRDKKIIKLHKKMLGYDLEITDKYIVKVFYDNNRCNCRDIFSTARL